jgi:hypothetical protein
MALFTDGEINGLQDLQRYESSLLNVASVEQIDLNAKMSLAADYIGSELLSYLLKETPRDLTKLVFVFQTVSARRALGVSDVVVTDQIKRWHAVKSIALAYEDAYNNQLNDRYQGKWSQYTQRVEVAAVQAYQIGIGLVWDPIPKASSPLLLSVTGTQFGNTFYVCLTWLNQGGQEGSPSDVVALQTVDSTQLLVRAVNPPPNATGWNVYVGLTPGGVTLQNSSAVAVQTDWLLPNSGVVSGNPLPTGQTPDRYVVEDRLLQRG